MVAQLIDQTVLRFPRFAQEQIAVAPLEKGGSDRKFYRIGAGPASLILTKYGSQREENRHYVAIARFLRDMGVRVPEIYFHDEQEGLIWMEDLGETDLWSFREERWEIRRPLYEETLSQVLALHTKAHTAPAAEQPKLQIEFNAELYKWEQGYFFENCLGRHFGIDAAAALPAAEKSRLEAIAEELSALPRVYVHRDFQSQNVVVLRGEACLIDFQGMRPGLPQYDIASLLYDPYVTLSAAERTHLLHFYREASAQAGIDVGPDYERVYDLCAMQRLMQALGAYGFLGLVKERPEFLRHIPVALASLQEVLARIEGLDQLAALTAALARR